MLEADHATVCNNSHICPSVCLSHSWVTQWRHWGWCNPGLQRTVSRLFFPKKPTTFFSHRPLQSNDLFSCRLLTTRTIRYLVCHVFFLNSATTFLNFIRVSPPGGCHPGRSAPQWRHCESRQIGSRYRSMLCSVPYQVNQKNPPYDFCWYYSNAWEFLYEILHDC